MTINELCEQSRGRRDGRFKRTVAASLHLGITDAETLRKALKISRPLLQSWLRWDYRTWVSKHIQKAGMKKEKDTVTALEKRLAELEAELENERLRSEAFEILLDIGAEKYGLDLRKKTGAKRSKG